MATPRLVRRLAFQLLFQMDAQGTGEAEAMRAWMATAEGAEGLSAGERESALETAAAAFAARAGSDAAFERLAPTWPARRQAAADRAILRLAHFEMHAGRSPAKAVVNDAIELAKEFSTDRSPAFINGLLDRVLKDLPGPAAG